tara:strand:- start:1353 stop:2288 length:936 start_codon:yes stop_codon:yes gene_type:complete
LPLFLNTQLLNQFIPELIKSSENELVLIVPYVQISKTIFKALQVANKNRVQIILIYRENKLNDREKSKLLSLGNISLLHHPHIHSKCYFNGDVLIIGSMNLYEYSELNNREMGSLFVHQELGDSLGVYTFCDQEIEVDSSDFFNDAKREMAAIVVSASVEHISRYYRESKFDVTILMSAYEQCQALCDLFSRYFLNKKFSPQKIYGDVYNATCLNYYDRIEVSWDDRRWILTINEPDSTLNELFGEWKQTYEEYEFSGFKYYWNSIKEPIYLYADWNHKMWEEDLELSEKIQQWKTGIDQIIAKYRNISKR